MLHRAVLACGAMSWLVVIGLLTALTATAGPASPIEPIEPVEPGRRASAPAADQLPPNWIVQVAHVAREDSRPQDLKRIESLTERLAGLAEHDPQRATVEQAIQREREAADGRRGFIIYGMRAAADAKGRPIEGGRGMVAFVVPADPVNRRTLEALKLGDPAPYVVIASAGSKPLLTVSGRAWIAARKATASTLDLGWDAPKMFASLPARPSGQPRATPADVKATLRFQQVKERDSGEGYRYSLALSAEPPPGPLKGTRRKVTLWYEVRYQTTRGDVIGPMLSDAVLERGENGTFSRSFGFDVIAPEGTALDPGGATVEVVAAVWE